jgi:hypothetical protein
VDAAARSEFITIHWACQRYCRHCSSGSSIQLASLYPFTAPCLQVKDPSQILKISILSLSCGSKAVGGLEVGNEGGSDFKPLELQRRTSPCCGFSSCYQ